MKSSAIFLNLGRGPIVREKDLAQALNDGEIQAAGLDVLCSEPMAADSPFFSVKDKSHLLITPHVAWAAVEGKAEIDEDHCRPDQGFFLAVISDPTSACSCKHGSRLPGAPAKKRDGTFCSNLSFHICYMLYLVDTIYFLFRPASLI